MSSKTAKKLIRSADSPSLWNCSLSPGWTREDLEVLRLAIMKFGLGSWSKIIKSSCLPGKTPSQLNLQTQRMMGQQSLAEFMGLHVDAQEVWNCNNSKQGSEYKRKNGCLINTGNNPTKEETKRKLEENRKRFGISQEKIDTIVLPLRPPAKELSTQEKRQKLKQLKMVLNCMQERLYQLKELGLFDPENEIVTSDTFFTSDPTSVNEETLQSDEGNDIPMQSEQKKRKYMRKQIIPLLDEEIGGNNDVVVDTTLWDNGKFLDEEVDSNGEPDDDDDDDPISEDSDSDFVVPRKKTISGKSRLK